jgi:hypothetical protein
MSAWFSVRTARDRLIPCLIGVVCSAIALVAARPYAGGWNDGSRLATVETLIDQHTWIIDQSTFVQVPSPVEPTSAPPYDPAETGLRAHGTLDKLFIHGHYYSDKSPVPALLMAGAYQMLQWLTAWTAATHADWFCWTMTLASCGCAYILAVFCVYRLGRLLHLPLSWNVAYTASFALGTIAIRYAEQVNNHILLLGVAAPLVLQIAHLERERRSGIVRRWRLAVIGTLAGIGYTIDLGVGPVILLCTAILILGLSPAATRSRFGQMQLPVNVGARLSGCVLFVLSAAPWLILHHALNYAIGGTFKPANANPEFFNWPGSPFSVRNLTGSWVHDGPFAFSVYAASMLAGKRGFLGHNLPLFLCLPAFVIVVRRRCRFERGLLWAGACSVGTWLLYAATSNNSSGQCCSIRWFVPLLAPAYYILGVLLRRRPRYRIDFLVLSCWGVLLVGLMREGPWMMHMVPFFWPIQAAALATWAVVHCWRRRRNQDPLVRLSHGSASSTPLAPSILLRLRQRRPSTSTEAIRDSGGSVSSPGSFADE